MMSFHVALLTNFATAAKSHMVLTSFLTFVHPSSLSLHISLSFTTSCAPFLLSLVPSQRSGLWVGLFEAWPSAEHRRGDLHRERERSCTPGCWPWWLWKTWTVPFIYFLDLIQLPSIWVSSLSHARSQHEACSMNCTWLPELKCLILERNSNGIMLSIFRPTLKANSTWVLYFFKRHSHFVILTKSQIKWDFWEFEKHKHANKLT